MRCFTFIFILFVSLSAHTQEAWARFKLVEPSETSWYLRLGGFIHIPNWYLPKKVFPAGADKAKEKRLKAGEFSEWLDLKKYAGKSLHGRMNRAGGVAEFPNMTLQFITDKDAAGRKIVIELADKADSSAVVKRFEETFKGDLTSVLISPNIRKDADSLETASMMTARRLAWAKSATGGIRKSPKNHIIQTSFWSPQRPELNVKEAEVLHLLGFNVIGNQRPEVQKAFPDLRIPGHTHHVGFGPGNTKEGIDALMKKHSAKQKVKLKAGVPFGFTDEICARPRIGKNVQARAHFHQWLKKRQILPADLGVKLLTEVEPLETPEAYREAVKKNAAAAARVFYYTSRFRQLAGTERIRWHTESFRKYFPHGPLTSTLVADHPYFGGTGLGMGMVPNTTWGGAPLALDWFDMARNKAVDIFGIEDWLGLQYMYGPNSTWEGFQLMGFQASMFRSGGRNDVSIISWITPSDEINLRLKAHSSLCQGAKHFFFWTYGPTVTSTENYWSDLRGSYDGIARVTSQLAAAEEVLFPAKLRKTKVALLYSISSDLWQPYNYRSMIERRGIYFSLIHGQYQVDMLTEEDIEAGRLNDYKVLYATGPNIRKSASAKIGKWVKEGGHLFATGNAGSRNEFNEPVKGLSEVLGLQRGAKSQLQDGNYQTRGYLNRIPYLDKISFENKPGFGVVGLKTDIKAASGRITAKFEDGSPAVIENSFGKGETVNVASLAGVSYIKDAKFVPKELAEKWPEVQRTFINSSAVKAGAVPAVSLSHAVVEAGVYEGPNGIALVLANFTYKKIDSLKIRLPVTREVARVYTADNPKEKIPFSTVKPTNLEKAEGYSSAVELEISLGLDQIILFR